LSGTWTFGLIFFDDDVLENKSSRNPTFSSDELLVVEARMLEGVNAVDSDTMARIVRKTRTSTMIVVDFVFQ
jgi:hypothetical protein